MNPTVCLEINHSNTLNEITKSCEKLITETQRDIEIFRNDQQQLHQKISQILQEDYQINSKLEILKGDLKIDNPTTASGESRDYALREKLTDDAFKNVKKQIDYLEVENNDLRSLNKTYKIYIENLEKEIQNYRNELFKPISVGEVKQKYKSTIKLMDNTICSQNTELKEQTQIIEHLFKQEKQLRDHIENLQKSIEEKDKEIKKHSNATETIAKLQKQLTEAVLHNKELQKSLKRSHEAIEERFKKEQSALQKVQEALTIAEAAVADKEEALKREKLVKEECDNIASTIGQVMDEAARKVEKDMETIRKKFIEKEKALIEENTKIIEELQNQKKFNQILDKRCNRFKQNFQEAVKDNENLLQQLEIAAKALYEKEEQLNKINSIKNNEAILQKRSDEQEFEIQRYVKTNKQLQDKYRMAVEDVTRKLKKQISHLENEVTNLKAENHVLKSQKLKD